jgi:hypothetical protein
VLKICDIQSLNRKIEKEIEGEERSLILILPQNINETAVVVVLTIWFLKNNFVPTMLLNKNMLLGALRMCSEENNPHAVRYEGDTLIFNEVLKTECIKLAKGLL